MTGPRRAFKAGDIVRSRRNICFDLSIVVEMDYGIRKAWSGRSAMVKLHSYLDDTIYSDFASNYETVWTEGD